MARATTTLKILVKYNQQMMIINYKLLKKTLTTIHQMNTKHLDTKQLKLPRMLLVMLLLWVLMVIKQMSRQAKALPKLIDLLGNSL